MGRDWKPGEPKAPILAPPPPPSPKKQQNHPRKTGLNEGFLAGGVRRLAEHIFDE